MMTDTRKLSEQRTAVPGDNKADNSSILLDRFAAIAAEYGDIAACAWGDSKLTYAALDQSSSHLAAELLAIHQGSRSPVAIFLDRSCEVLIAAMAAAKAGLPYVPLNMSWPDERIKKVLNKVEAKVAFTSFENPVPQSLLAGLTVLNIDAKKEASQATEQPLQTVPKPSSDTPLYILFTSGSTGEPKGVVVTHANVVQFATSPECPGFEAGKKVTACCATAFDLSVAEIWGGMLNGCTQVCSPKDTFLESRRCADFLLKNDLDYAVLPTAVFNALASQDASIFGSLDKLILCGELPNSALCKKVQELAPPKDFYNTYGPTECTVFVTIEKLGDIDGTAIIPAGKPLPTASIYIIDENGNPLGSGQWGEVVIGGQGVAAGYFNDLERTSEVFVPAENLQEKIVYHTGDRGMLNDNGSLIVSGRFDDQIKISGTRIELGEIKTVLNAAPNVQMGHVIYRDDYGLIAYAVMDNSARHHDEASVKTEIRAFLEKLLPAPMLPRHILFVPSLPLNANGKVDSAQLPQPDLRESGGDRTHANGVLEAFRDALFNDAFTEEDSFLEYGGNSLIAATLVGTLHRQTGVWVPLDYFSKPKTAHLVQMFITSAQHVSTALTRNPTREQLRF